MTIITCNLKGGLGNQLFQIFVTISYAFEYKLVFKFEDKEILINNTNRNTYWNSLFKEVKNMLVTKSFPSLLVVKENHFHFTPIPSQIFINHKDICLDGYYQSDKYFRHNFLNICKILKIDKNRNDILNKYNDKLSLEKCISIHFRLGDYKKFQHVHPIMKNEYYENALSYIITHSKDSYLCEKVLFFCEDEDIDTVLQSVGYLKDKFPALYFERCPDDLHDWEQMLLMSCCKHNIIANSSFSWWGAYLNINTEKIVCYPSIWFGQDINHNVNDLFPSEWIKIS